jgi:tetratricopeptide (TPR) repeat protein
MAKKRRAPVQTLSPSHADEPKPSYPSKSALLQIGVFALIFCAAIAAYWPAIHGDYLWDDDGHLTKPELQSLHGLWRIWFEFGATQQYYPFLHSAFWVEHLLWGDDVVGYHLVNILLHATSACLLVLILRRLALPAPWLAGLIFALHPICVESVAWITEQKNTLSGVFYFGSTLAYLGFDQSRARSRYVFALALFILASLSKTTTSTLPAALLVVFWWQRGRLSWKRDVLPLLPWFALSAAAAALTSWVERVYIGAKGGDFSLSVIERVLLACRVIWFYGAKTLWPANLMFFYPRWNVSAAVWWQWLFPAGILALVIVLVYVARRNRGPLAAFLLFAGTLFPALGFFNVYPFLFSYVADHFQYLATVAIIVPAVAVLVQASRRIRSMPAWLPPCAAGVLLLVLGFMTSAECGTYRDSETLYRETIARNPESWLAHNNLAYMLLNVPGALPEAVSHLTIANRLNPNYAEAHVNLGIAYSLEQKWPEAIAQYEAALRLDPKYVLAHANLGNALSNVPGRLPEAVAQYEAALRYDPTSAPTHYNLARALTRIPGREPEAIAHLEKALELSPGWPQAQQLLNQLKH